MLTLLSDDALTALHSSALYTTLAQASSEDAATLPPAQVAQRYQQLLTLKFAQLTPHRRDIATVFSTAMHDDLPRALENDPMRAVFQQVVAGSTDAPAKPQDSSSLAQLLYALYVLSVVFWLYDRTTERKATAYLIEFLYDMIRLLRPMMVMPMFTKAMQKMAVIMEMVFGTTTA